MAYKWTQEEQEEQERIWREEDRPTSLSRGGILAETLRLIYHGPYEVVCAGCGGHETHRLPTRYCYRCSEEMLARIDAQRAEGERAKQAQQEREREAAWRRWANIPRLTMVWETLRPRADIPTWGEAVAAARAWAAGEGPPVLVLAGDRGTGKTHLAVAAVRSLLDAGSWAHFEGVAVLLDRIRQGFDQGQGQDAPTQELAECANLVLDDLGTERPSKWAAERLYRILDARWLAGRRTLVTTNYPADVLAERLGETGPALVERLWDKEVSRVVVLGGPSYRTGRTW